MKKQETKAVKKGMNRMTHPSELKDSEYSFALNTNIQSNNEGELFILQNETSNTLCSRFKEGYIVTKAHYDRVRERTYYFLLQENAIGNNCSEVGYINANQDVVENDAIEKTCDCELEVVLEEGLENISHYEATCEYTTLLSDYCPITGECNGCLNFSKENPIKDVEIRHAKTGDEIYFTDNLNPQRFINVDYIQEYFEDKDECTGVITAKCLDCEELRVFRKYKIPKIEINSIENGGRLPMGRYAAFLCYSEQNGEELSDYLTQADGVDIKDLNNNILPQTDLDALTNIGFSIDVKNVDDDYDFYKIVIGYASGNNPAWAYTELGVYPIDNKKVFVAELPKIKRDDSKAYLENLLKKTPTYEKAKGLTQSGGYLIHHSPTQKREINMQPIANLLGGFVEWRTVLATENIFKDGALSAKYKHYMRDEVYPASFQLFSNDGYRFPLTPFIARPSVGTEKDPMPSDENVESIRASRASCGGEERLYRWQFENTASVKEGAYTECGDLGTEESTYETEESCETEEYSIGSGQIFVNVSGGLTDWVNNNNTFINGSSETWLQDIKVALNRDYGKCSVKEDGCEIIPPTLTETVEVVSVEGEDFKQVSSPCGDYDRKPAPEECDFIETENSDPTQPPGADLRDVAVENALGYNKTVWKKKVVTNTTCSNAIAVSNITNTVAHLKDEWAIGNMSSLLSGTTITNASVIDVTKGFYNKVHSNAIWFKGQFTLSNFIVFDITHISCTKTDDNTNNSIRITVWDSCSSPTEISGYSTIIDDITNASDTGCKRLLIFNKEDFTGTTPEFFIAIDSPIKENIEVQLTISDPSSGGGSLTIDSNSFTVNGGTNANTASQAFITDNSALSATLGIDMELGATSDTVMMRVTQEQLNSFVFTKDNPGDGIKVTWETIENYYTIQPPCGCFGIYDQVVKLEDVAIYESMTFVKKYTYKLECTTIVPVINIDCKPVPYKQGKFGYVESTYRYPCNEELYDSSWLKIKEANIPTGIKSDFETYYTNSGGVDINGDYVLNPETNFMDKNIRHYRFPDNHVSPFIYESGNNPLQGNSFVYPIGFSLDNEVVEFFLDTAVENHILTQEERDSIVGYDVFRGDRRANRSILSKGIAFTPLEYKEKYGKSVLYPNYPLNQLGGDLMNGGTQDTNEFLTYHSPDNLFRKPTLGGEINIEGFLQGMASNTFSAMKDHPNLTVLGEKARKLATAIAIAEAGFEFLMQSATITTNSTTGHAYTMAVGIALAIVLLAAAALTNLFKAGTYRYQWLTTFEELGKGYNHAYIGISEAFYNTFLDNKVGNSLYRALNIATYIKPGDITVRDEYGNNSHKINNHNREESVFLKLGTSGMSYPPSILSEVGNREQITYNDTGTFQGNVSKSSVPYISMKSYSPGQWGEIGSIDWLPTNYTSYLDEDNECDIIFGGDTYISRLYIKRKFPFFRETAHKLAPEIPFKYSSYVNIQKDSIFRGFLDYKTSEEAPTFGSMVFPENKSEFRLYSGSGGTDSVNEFYVTDKYKFLTQYYGIPSFLVESEINCNLRHGEFEDRRQFIPEVPDVTTWLQQSTVPISEKEYFFYNDVYSKAQHKKFYLPLPSDYEKEKYDKLNDLSNSVIWSSRDNQSGSLRAPWRNYAAFDIQSFNKNHGELIDVSGLESDIVYFRYTDGYSLLKSQVPNREVLAKSLLGNGAMFTESAGSFNETDIGYAGTQNKTLLSTPFGHYSVDAKRGKIFEVKPNAQGMSEISQSMGTWFKEQLPYKILKKIPNANIDNSYNGVGLTMGWDDTLSRVFITKRDYIPIGNDKIFYDEEFGYYIEQTEEDETVRVSIEINDENYFEDASWTVAYSPLTTTWISYYSFKPNYYVSYNYYFQTGINNLGSKEHGVWSHFPFMSSYQVFYGTLHPWIVEYSSGTNGTDGNMNSINYWLEARKYYNKFNFSNIFGESFNKAYIYNDFQNSGELDLKVQENNQVRQRLEYPKTTGSSTEILQSEIDNKWSFNYIYNHIKNEKSGLPPWINDNVNILKELNTPILDYSSRRKDRLRGDYFVVRMVQDAESRFKYLYRLQSDTRDYYN